MKQFAAAMIGAFLAFPALAISVAPAPTGSGTVEFSFTRFDGPMGRVAFNGTFPSLGPQGIFNGVPAQISATEALPDGTVMGFANLGSVSSVAFRYDFIDPGSTFENLLSFAPAAFNGVAVGERFLLGTLTYQNGAWFGSGATPEQNIPSVFQFEIITRSNDGDRFNQFCGPQEEAHNMAATETARLAVLIDADNATASVVKELLEEVAKYGTATVKRAYGDWTTQNLVGWKEHLHRHAIQPMQQFAYTKGKNSTDSAFIIDAMDLLYAGNVDGFCLVSSDSDFTRLATRMREAGKVVYGLGERKTPEPFIAACDKFIFFEVLQRPSDAAPLVQVAGMPDLKGLVTHAIKETSRDSGWASLAAVGSFINKNNTSFDPRNYGFTKLSELVRQQVYLEVKETADASGFVHLSVRTR